MTTGLEKRSTHSTFFVEHPDRCKSLFKDFVNGDTTNSELSPAIRDDPVLQDQCRRFGYMIMQVGDQIRQVYCGSPTMGHTEEGLDCPQCGTPMCLQHLSEHLGAKLVDPTSMQIGQPESPGMNPNPYLSAPPGVDTRPGMSTWDNNELNRNQLSQKAYMLRDLKEDREGPSLVKSMWRQIEAKRRRQDPQWIQKNGGGEHTMDPQQILSLDPVSRLIFEVWAYNDEYKAPASTADIAVELATRGIDQEFQDQLEAAAHANEDWLPQVLEELASRGDIGKSPYGGWIPSTRIVTKGGVGSGITGHTTAHPVEDTLVANTKVTVNSPGLAYHGEVGKVLYSTQPPGSSERNYIIEMGDGKKILRIGSQVTPTEPLKTPTTPPVEAPKPTVAPGIPIGRVPIEGPKMVTQTRTTQQVGPGVKGYTGEVEKEGYGKNYPVVGTEMWASSSFAPNFHGKVLEYQQGGLSGVPWVKLGNLSTESGEESHIFHGSNLSVEKPPESISRSVSIMTLVENRLTERAGKVGHQYSDVQAKGAPKIEGVTITHWEPAKGGKLVQKDHQILYDEKTNEAIRDKDGHLQWVDTEMRTVPYGEKEIREAMEKFTPQEREGLKLEVWDDKTVNTAVHYYNIPSSRGGFKTGGGLYMPGQNRIYIGRMTDYFLKRKEIPGVGPYVAGTYLHETGHYVYYNKLTETERSAWKDNYSHYRGGRDGTPREDFGGILGDYSEKNSGEGWAEATRFYKLKPDYLKEKMPKTYALIDKIYTRIKEHPEMGTQGRASVFD